MIALKGVACLQYKHTTLAPCVGVGALDPVRKMESQWSLPVSLPLLHQSWNLPVFGGPVQRAKLTGSYFCSLYCLFLPGLAPCTASLPSCASTNANTEETAHFAFMGVASEGRILAPWQGGPRIHTSKILNLQEIILKANDHLCSLWQVVISFYSV